MTKVPENLVSLTLNTPKVSSAIVCANQKSVLESVKEATEINMVQPGFAMFGQVAGTIGCLIKGPQFNADFSFPHEKLKSSIRKNTGLIVVINPNNPTGTSVSQDQIEDLLISFPNIPLTVLQMCYLENIRSCF